MRLALAAAVVVLTFTSTAHADRAWKRRYLHLGAIGAGSVAYALSEVPFKDALEPDACRWCDPPGFDATARNALVWSDPGRAYGISSITAFVLAPAAGLGLLWASSWKERSAARWVDDAIPVLEAAVLFGLLDQVAKFGTGRERPFVHYAEPGRPAAPDDNLSFFSGHTGTSFAIATAAGTVAHLRHYRFELAIWASGIALSTTTGYLRIAADKHWLSDVLVGAAVGSAIGLSLPLVLHKKTLAVVPTGEGVLVTVVLTMRLALAAAVAVLTISTTAHADRAWKRRYVHIGAVVGAGTAYIVTEAALKPSLAPDDCRWCEPPGFDASLRSALVWDHTGRAATISDITGFYLAPISGLGLVMLSSWHDRSLGRWLDDTLPIVESSIATGLLQTLAKYVAARQRPFVLHADPGRAPELDDDMSFFSGHTASAFAIATAAGTVAHLRGYRLEPLIWASGLTLAAATGYLRIAADRHWFSDVLTGAAVGSAVGLALPRVLHRRSLTVVPTGEGVLVSGEF